MIREYCCGKDLQTGRECREFVTSSDDQRVKGWTVVMITPMVGGDSVRKILCRVCTRNHRSVFRDA